MRYEIIVKLIRALLHLLYIFPVKRNKICLLCFDGSKLGYDAKAIVEYVHLNKLPYNIVWLTKDKEINQTFHLYDTKFKVYKSLSGVWELMTSGTVIFNITAPPQVPFRKKQILVNTWHGCGNKKAGKYTNNYSKYTMSLATCMLSHAQKYTEWIIRDSFDYEGDVIDSGVPRNDVFFSDKIDLIKNRVCKKFSIGNKKIVLYAPTFRGDFESSRAELDINALINSLKERFGGDWVVFYRNHPLAKGDVEYSEKIINVSLYPDMQELLCAADVLITDYSSSCWDYSMLHRPIFLFADDIDKYESESLFMPFTDLPYSIAKTNEELDEIIQNFSEEDYLVRVKKYHEFMGNYEEGTACKKMFSYIENRRYGK